MTTYRDQYVRIFGEPGAGRDIVLFAVSADIPVEQHEWARDAEFPWLFGSDPGSEVGQLYGAFSEGRDGSLIDNRTLFVIDPEGRIAWRAAPFREVDPTAYDELAAALEEIAPTGAD
jgi:peroxiredoxin